MATMEQRVSYLEGKIESLATKEDLANLRADMGALETRIAHSLTTSTRWNIGVMLLVGGAAVAILRLT